jgi:hypothetical protein
MAGGSLGGRHLGPEKKNLQWSTLSGVQFLKGGLAETLGLRYSRYVYIFPSGTKTC